MLTRDELKAIAVATVGIALLGGIAAHELGNRPETDHYEIVEIARSAVPESDTEKEDAAEDCVYITPSGKRWHLEASCAGENAEPVELKNAENRGYTPCKKCAGG